MGVTASYPEQPRPGLDNRKLIWLWLGLLTIPLIAVVLFAVFQPVKVVPRIGLAPGYSFTDMNAQRLTNEDFRGSVVIYNFTTTHCEAPCVDSAPTMQEIQAMLQRIDTGGIPVMLVTVALDPERDTPERLRAYAAQLGADPTLWHFVTGTPARLKQVVGGGFGLYYTQDENGVLKFEPMLALVDGNGLLRAQYKRGLPDVDFVERDLKLIFDEVRNSSGASGLVYEAAHLFACYATY
ncbi:MAG TPA: SCO family protein [Chloroflexi bacterium]|nr:SCO family protein [Chloroflexota bacterium]